MEDKESFFSLFSEVHVHFLWGGWSSELYRFWDYVFTMHVLPVLYCVDVVLVLCCEADVKYSCDWFPCMMFYCLCIVHCAPESGFPGLYSVFRRGCGECAQRGSTAVLLLPDRTQRTRAHLSLCQVWMWACAGVTGCKLLNGVIPAQVAMSNIAVRYHLFGDGHVWVEGGWGGGEHVSVDTLQSMLHQGMCFAHACL